MTEQLVWQIIGNLVVIILILVKTGKAWKPETSTVLPPAAPTPTTCPQHAGLVGWMKRIETGIVSLSEDLTHAREEIARINGRMEQQ